MPQFTAPTPASRSTQPTTQPAPSEFARPALPAGVQELNAQLASNHVSAGNLLASRPLVELAGKSIHLSTQWIKDRLPPADDDKSRLASALKAFHETTDAKTVALEKVGEQLHFFMEHKGQQLKVGLSVRGNQVSELVIEALDERSKPCLPLAIKGGERYGKPQVSGSAAFLHRLPAPAVTAPSGAFTDAAFFQQFLTNSPKQLAGVDATSQGHAPARLPQNSRNSVSSHINSLMVVKQTLAEHDWNPAAIGEITAALYFKPDQLSLITSQPDGDQHLATSHVYLHQLIEQRQQIGTELMNHQITAAEHEVMRELLTFSNADLVSLLAHPQGTANLRTAMGHVVDLFAQRRVLQSAGLNNEGVLEVMNKTAIGKEPMIAIVRAGGEALLDVARDYMQRLIDVRFHLAQESLSEADMDQMLGHFPLNDRQLLPWLLADGGAQIVSELVPQPLPLPY